MNKVEQAKDNRPSDVKDAIWKALRRRRAEEAERIKNDAKAPLPVLERALAARIGSRLQAALTQVGNCIDDLHGSAHSAPGVPWILAIDEVQERLVQLTVRANAIQRAQREARDGKN